MELLSGMAAALAGLAIPSALKSLGMSNVEAADPLLDKTRRVARPVEARATERISPGCPSCSGFL